MVERLADAARVPHESDERYRTLTDARRRAEAASEAKSRVLATVSHEFRTPLNGILGLTGLLLETPLTPDQATYARGVHSSGEALLALVDDILDFSRIEAGRLDLRPPHRPETQCRKSPPSPPAPTSRASTSPPRSGRACPPRSRSTPRACQVLINLAGNGVKFTDSGGVTVVAAGRRRHRLQCGDSGRGSRPRIPSACSANSSRATGPEPPPRRRPGLAISRQIVAPWAATSPSPRVGGGLSSASC
jgi:light-regulated signal transduction histidine kinase (bacteriophytochrome)